MRRSAVPSRRERVSPRPTLLDPQLTALLACLSNFSHEARLWRYVQGYMQEHDSGDTPSLNPADTVTIEHGGVVLDLRVVSMIMDQHCKVCLNEGVLHVRMDISRPTPAVVPASASLHRFDPHTDHVGVWGIPALDYDLTPPRN